MPRLGGLADCYNQMGTVMWAAGRRPTCAARAAAASGLADRRQLGESHAALAYVHHYDWEWAAAAGVRPRDRAQPNYALVHVWRRTTHLAESAGRGSSREEGWHSTRCRCRQHQRGLDVAVRRRTQEAAEGTAPRSPSTRLRPGHSVSRPRTCSSGVPTRRSRRRRRAPADGGGPPGVADVASVYALAGRRREASSCGSSCWRCGSGSTSRHGRWPSCPSRCRTRRRFFWLERAFEERSNGLATWSRTGRRSGPQRPRFQDCCVASVSMGRDEPVTLREAIGAGARITRGARLQPALDGSVHDAPARWSSQRVTGAPAAWCACHVEVPPP